MNNILFSHKGYECEIVGTNYCCIAKVLKEKNENFYKYAEVRVTEIIIESNIESTLIKFINLVEKFLGTH